MSGIENQGLGSSENEKLLKIRVRDVSNVQGEIEWILLCFVKNITSRINICSC